MSRLRQLVVFVRSAIPRRREDWVPLSIVVVVVCLLAAARVVDGPWRKVVEPFASAMPTCEAVAQRSYALGINWQEERSDGQGIHWQEADSEGQDWDGPHILKCGLQVGEKQTLDTRFEIKVFKDADAASAYIRRKAGEYLEKGVQRQGWRVPAAEFYSREEPLDWKVKPGPAATTTASARVGRYVAVSSVRVDPADWQISEGWDISVGPSGRDVLYGGLGEMVANLHELP